MKRQSSNETWINGSSSGLLLGGFLATVCLAWAWPAWAAEPAEASSQSSEAASHWRMQEVSFDGKWLTRQQVAEIASRDKRLAEYRKLRDQGVMTVTDQAALARWCKKNNLPDEERASWLSVLQLQPDNADAVKGLGLHPYHGLLLTNAQIQQCRSEIHVMNKAIERRRPLVVQWAKSIEKRDQAEAVHHMGEVQKIASSAEMLALERVLWQDLGSKKDKNRAYEALSLELIVTLRGMPEHAAIESLVRHAVFHNRRLSAPRRPRR